MLNKNLDTKKTNTNQLVSKSNGPDDKRQFFIDTIAKFCDKCGHQYSISDVNLVQDNSFSSIIHFSCSNCKSNHIATFVKPVGMSSRVPVNTDLTVEEITQFAQEDRINSDQVLDVYELLDHSRHIKEL